MKWDWRDWPVISACDRGWSGYSSGKSVSRVPNPDMDRVGGKVFLVARWSWETAQIARTANDRPWLHSALVKRNVSATSQMFGLQSVLLDWGWKFSAHVWMDATAGIATGSRRRFGRVKHIDTVFLWVQTVITEGAVTFGKKPTTEMLADFLTKHVDAATMLNCIAWLVWGWSSGQARARWLEKCEFGIR